LGSLFKFQGRGRLSSCGTAAGWVAWLDSSGAASWQLAGVRGGLDGRECERRHARPQFPRQHSFPMSERRGCMRKSMCGFRRQKKARGIWWIRQISLKLWIDKHPKLCGPTQSLFIHRSSTRSVRSLGRRRSVFVIVDLSQHLWRRRFSESLQSKASQSRANPRSETDGRSPSRSALRALTLIVISTWRH